MTKYKKKRGPLDPPHSGERPYFPTHTARFEIRVAPHTIIAFRKACYAQGISAAEMLRRTIEKVIAESEEASRV